MELFYLLRNNHESGPFSLKELRNHPLYTTDLLWIDGESTQWAHPNSIPALANVVLQVRQPRPPVAKTTKQGLATNSALGSAATDIHDEELAAPSFEELKLKYGKKLPRRKAWRKSISIGTNLIGLATFVIGVMMAAFMVKKAIDSIDYPPMVATAESREIESETLPVSTSTHAAFGAPQAETKDLDQQIPFEEPALNKPGLGANPSAAKKPLQPVEPTTKAIEKPGVEKSQTNPQVKDESTGENEKAVEKEEPKPVEVAATEKPVARPSLSLSANQYKVGLLGGISNLELSVSNATSIAVEKAVVEVEYLKPNGKVTSSQTVTVNGITPGSSKKVTVPDHGRGVSVRYRVVNIEF